MLRSAKDKSFADTHPTFATVRRKVAIRQCRTGLFESRLYKQKGTLPCGTIPFYLSMGYEKDIFAVLRMGLNSRIKFKIIREADTFGTYSLFTFTYYLIDKFWEKSEKWRVNSEKVKSTSFCRNLSIFGGDGEIRTRGRVSANWFRVSPVMTTSIRLHILSVAAITVYCRSTILL